MIFFVLACLFFCGQTFGMYENLLPGLPAQQMPTSKELRDFPLPHIKDENVKRTVIHTLANISPNQIRIPQDLNMLLSDHNAVEAVIAHSPLQERNSFIELFFFAAVLYHKNDIVRYFMDHGIALEKMKSVSHETPAEFAAYHKNIQAFIMFSGDMAASPSRKN